MMGYPEKSTPRHIFSALAAACLAGFFLVVTGCSYVEDIHRKTEKLTVKATRKMSQIGRLDFSTSKMKKTVVIGPIADQTNFQIKNFGRGFQAALSKNLRENCTAGRFVLAGDADFPPELTPLPRDPQGRIDNFKLAAIGRQSGINDLIRGTVIDIREYMEDRGILWFRDTHKFLQVLVNVEVFDMETAAKLVDESYLYETELEWVEFEEPETDKQSLIPMIDAAIAEAADFLGDEICYALGTQHWTGFVVSIGGKTVEISAGTRAGLSAGQVLDVYAKGQAIEGAGQRFFKPGEKIGEIRLTQVTADGAFGESTDGGEIPSGATVREQ